MTAILSSNLGAGRIISVMGSVGIFLGFLWFLVVLEFHFTNTLNFTIRFAFMTIHVSLIN